MLNTTSNSEVAKVSYSFDFYKQQVKTESAELYTALKTMSWRAKQAALASD